MPDTEMQRAALVLESGATFEGELVGAAAADSWGEVVFNTCMSGYQEIVTDPSYAGQMVVMTYPLIGNYGCRTDTAESASVHCRALIVRELSPDVGHAGADRSLQEELAQNGVTCLTGVDTRALVRHLREHGTLRGVIGVVTPERGTEQLVEKARALPTISDEDHVAAVSVKGALAWTEKLGVEFQQPGRQEDSPRVVVIDLGVKYNQLRALASRGADLVVLPHDSNTEDVLRHSPAGVLLSNGPGDPVRMDAAVALCCELLKRKIPLLGICLGHQVLGRAIGASTSRLHFGHHGGNHPVRDEISGRVYMTSQNHEFQVDGDSIPEGSGWYISERNLHDNSVEGLRHESLPAFSVQYHPEGAPGPQDRADVFDEFMAMVRGEEWWKPLRSTAAHEKPKSVLVIGSGPVVIGQAAEFDYAGTQACRALREEGVRVILVNSNPATIMTDEESADAVYIEPLTVEVLERIIADEKPEGLLGTIGGQTGLNLTIALAEAGVLERHGVRLLGTPLEAIRNAEDRAKFKELLREIGEPVPDSATVSSLAEAREFCEQVGLPLVVRPAFTLGGTGGGMCDTNETFVERVNSGLAASPINQVLVERSLTGWREVEYEVMRDAAGTSIVVCAMENIDPMGVHTGDSIVVAPTQTLTDREHQQLRSAALRIIGALGIAGGCNVQFAIAPDSHEYHVIEVNPRVSRSSALASKATGYPIARVAAKIAVGMRLDEIPNAVTQKTCAAYEPALDYCVVKIPRWPFDKFPQGDRRLGTQMKSTGEVMAIGRTFEAALNKALRSLEQTPPEEDDLHEPVLIDVPNDRRIYALMEALRVGNSTSLLSRRTGINRWFIERMAAIVEVEQQLRWGQSDDELLAAAKRMSLSDQRIADLSGVEATAIEERRASLGLVSTFKCVDTCAAEFEAATPYYYSCFESEDEGPRAVGESRGIVVLGSGPIRIGQGIEFDYCSVHAARSLRELGYDAIMINSNPETVSTDFDCSTRLYFEPLDVESAVAISKEENAIAIVTQFGGQTAINLASPMAARGLTLWGTSASAIDATEERSSFEKVVRKLGVAQPPGASTRSVEEAVKIAEEIGYPVLVRPSYVLGGRAMEIAHTRETLERYLRTALKETSSSETSTVLVDKYIFGTEVDVDAISDGETVVIPGLLEHVERAGVHSGDSMAAYPAPHLPPKVVRQIVFDTTRMAKELRIKGLCNLQFVVSGGVAQVLEVNPRASRTVPFLSKVSGVPMVDLAIKVMAGEKLEKLGWSSGLSAKNPLVAIKAPVFSTSKLTSVDGALGPEMKSTGEVMGVDVSFEAAVEKAFLAALGSVPREGGVLCSIADADKGEALPILSQLGELGFTLYATTGTAHALAAAGIQATPVGKLDRQRPNMIDVINEGRVALVINTVSHFDDSDDATALDVHAAGRSVKDGYRIRQAAEHHRIPCCTSLDTAAALVDAVARQRRGEVFSVAPLAAYRTAAVPSAR